MVVSIHQPNLFPWMGLFHKISHSERFVVFDHVQAPQGKSWLTRSKIILNEEPRWLTLPIHRVSLQKIVDIQINYETNFVRKHLGTLRQAYGKTEYFDQAFPLVEEVYSQKFKYLVDFNLMTIRTFSERMNLSTEFLRSSEVLKEEDTLDGIKGNDLVLRLCQICGGSSYISGTGCLDFIRPEEFVKGDVQFQFQNFICPEYPQVNCPSFVPAMSILDAVFNVGFAGVKALLEAPMLLSPEQYHELSKV